MKKTIISLLALLVVAAFCLVMIFPLKMTALPSPFIIAASIVGLVAMAGAVFSLYLRRRSRTRYCQRL